MYNQNWHVVYGPVRSSADVSPDTQLTDAMEMVWRMDDKPYSSPGPEIVVNVYGEFTDPNGERDDGTWPPAVVTTQVAYEIRDADGEVDNSDYEYQQGDLEFPLPGEKEPTNPALFFAVQLEANRIAARGDMGWDWDGKSIFSRSGGPV